ncbi:MAG: 50S ribosomal protein L3 [Acidobacteriota bacterium]|nr:MAG: 50S ribosomal protein L3 [Acidobacteriota bacterium]
MINGIIGRKLGMTQLFAEDGTVIPVTVIKAGPCVVVQKKSAAGRDGYNAVQLGLVEDKPIKMKRVTKPMRGHFEKTGGGLPPTRVLREIRLTEEPEAEIGEQVKADLFSDGDMIEVVGKSKGRGFAGTIKRHNFQRGPMTHGSMNIRRPGSIGQSASPSRVLKGTKSSGHMGDARVTARGLTVAKVDAENNLIMVRGSVPGPNGGLVVVKKSEKQKG